MPASNAPRMLERAHGRIRTSIASGFLTLRTDAPSMVSARPGYASVPHHVAVHVVRPSAGMMAFRCGGLSAATYHWLMAKYETPLKPTLPLLHGCTPAHSIVS